MARIFDVIEYANEMKDEIVHRFPETGIGDVLRHRGAPAGAGESATCRDAWAGRRYRDAQHSGPGAPSRD